MENCVISEVRRMSDSLIGKNSRIAKDEGRPAVYQFMVGDSSEIRIP